uniref:Uncharacterized protein n=1 Tax=Utricularia reniformis TaxID=192314 RepID=A0A1Y0B496_9LAMI|nr:hypothetical protein AEK19_MT2063 [Utricularia reniformis]ART32220.1 hypothetical protein AEK19_MT2063 [Utricularia reniformis]
MVLVLEAGEIPFRLASQGLLTSAFPNFMSRLAVVLHELQLPFPSTALIISSISHWSRITLLFFVQLDFFNPASYTSSLRSKGIYCCFSCIAGLSPPS